MMLILRKNEVFFLDRDNSVFQVENLRFPLRKDPQRHIENTLLDGVSLVLLEKYYCDICTSFDLHTFLSCVQCPLTHPFIIFAVLGNGHRQDRNR